MYRKLTCCPDTVNVFGDFFHVRIVVLCGGRENFHVVGEHLIDEFLLDERHGLLLRLRVWKILKKQQR